MDNAMLAQKVQIEMDTAEVLFTARQVSMCRTSAVYLHNNIPIPTLPENK
jgi:hypothetical protein